MNFGSKTPREGRSQKMKVLASTMSSSDVRGPGKNTSTVRALMSNSVTNREDMGIKGERLFEKPPEIEYLSPRKLELHDHPEQFPVTLKISSKMENREVMVPKNLNLSVKEFKEQHFAMEMNLEGVGIRLICNGKEMRDSHSLSDHNLVEHSTIYVFFFKKEDKIRRDTSLATKSEVDFHNVTDMDALDFDYFKEKQNMTEEEVVWKRFCFHAPYIYKADIPVISDPVLFKREYDFMKDYGDKRHDPDHFRRYTFKGFSPVELIKERTATFLVLILMGLILGFPMTFALLFKINPSLKVAISLGALINMSAEFVARLLFNTSLYAMLFSLIP